MRSNLGTCLGWQQSHLRWQMNVTTCRQDLTLPVVLAVKIDLELPELLLHIFPAVVDVGAEAAAHCVAVVEVEMVLPGLLLPLPICYF